MKARAGIRKLPDTYFELVRRFPLTVLQDDRHLDEAQAVLNDLLRTRLDRGGEAYLEVLSDLIESYEEKHVPIADASESDVLRELLRTNGLTQSELAAAVGIAQSTISAVLNGTRELTRSQVESLARYFKVSPAAFLPA